MKTPAPTLTMFDLKKTKIFRLTLVSFTCLVVFVGSCKQPEPNDEFARLPELPADIAATLDPDTMATKIPASDPEPPTPTGGVAAVPCCGITQRMTLKVRYSYTKCGPLRDFIATPFGKDLLTSKRAGPVSDAAPSLADLRVFKLSRFNDKTILDQQVCLTSQGPWNASFTEQRNCFGPSPQDTLIINAFGDVVTFVWPGGTANHPSSVQLVSCRLLNTTQFKCGGLSTCECPSRSCPATEPCDCDLQGW